MKAKVTRKRDNLSHSGNLKFIEWNKNNTGKEVHDKPEVGYSCVIDLNIESFLEFKIPTYKWLTSPITKVISDNEFETLNSKYTIEYDR